MKTIKIGTATLIHGDCEEFMKDLPDKSFDLAVVDPPYGIGIVQQMEKTVSSSSSMMRLSNGITGGHWDNAIPDAEYFIELKSVSQEQIIWGGNYFLDYLGATSCFCIWDKMNGTNPMADAELAWSSFDSSVRMFRMHHFSHGYDAKIHPTQKPVKLYEWIYANYAKPGQTILDTHGGSMSSVIAALNMGFEITCIEKDEDYFNAAVERVIKSQQQQKLF
jgi:site-specific DNA-methyltransferase (adenine-specific)